MPQPPSRQSDNPSMLEINDPTTESVPQTNLVTLEAANTTYALILILTTQKYTDIDVWKILS